MKSFLLMVTFLTRIPLPIHFEVDNDDFARGVLWLPIIGALIGLPLYLWQLWGRVTNTGANAFILLLIYIGMTGGIHLDGLADYWDGIFSGRDKEGILRIMKDSAIGTFGVVGLCLYFVGMYSGFLVASPIGLFLMPILARTIGLMFCAFGRYPREKGLGQSMVDYGRWQHGAIALVVLFVLTYLLGAVYFISAVIVIIVMLLMLVRTTQVIGGVTGDVIGAAIETSHVTWLLTLTIVGGLL